MHTRQQSGQDRVWTEADPRTCNTAPCCPVKDLQSNSVYCMLQHGTDSIYVFCAAHRKQRVAGGAVLLQPSVHVQHEVVEVHPPELRTTT